jgi:hypothetical protein
VVWWTVKRRWRDGRPDALTQAVKGLVGRQADARIRGQDSLNDTVSSSCILERLERFDLPNGPERRAVVEQPNPQNTLKERGVSCVIRMRIDFILPHLVELDDWRTAVFGFVEAADYEEPVHKPQGVMSIELETGIGPAGWTDL